MTEARSSDERALRVGPFHEVSGSQSLLHVSCSGCLNTGSPIGEQDWSSTVPLKRLIEASSIDLIRKTENSRLRPCQKLLSPHFHLLSLYAPEATVSSVS